MTRREVAKEMRQAAKEQAARIEASRRYEIESYQIDQIRRGAKDG